MIRWISISSIVVPASGVWCAVSSMIFSPRAGSLSRFWPRLTDGHAAVADPAPDGGDFLEEGLHRLSWGSDHLGSRRHVGHDTGFGTDTCPGADAQMACQAHLARQHDLILQDCGAGYARLGDDDTGLTDADVVADLHQIIDPGAGADHGVLQRAAVDGGVGADLHIVLDQHAAELRDGMEAVRGDGEAEAVLADAGARIDVDAVDRSARATGWRAIQCERRGRFPRRRRSPPWRRCGRAARSRHSPRSPRAARPRSSGRSWRKRR